MDIQRAKEIASSPIMANVTYNGSQIYIEDVDEQSNTAKIHPLNQPKRKQVVSLNNLIEH